MKAKKLQQIEEFQDLEAKKAIVANLTIDTDFESKRTVVVALLDVYGSLERCNQLLLEKEMDQLFSKYVGGRA